MKTIIALFAAFFLFACTAWGQEPKVDYSDLNPGGIASRLITQKIKIDLIEEIAQVIDDKGNPLPLYEAWVRLENDPSVKTEKYLHIFMMQDSTGILALFLKDGITSIEQKVQIEVYVPNEMNVEDVLMLHYKKMVRDNSREDRKAFRKEVDAMMDKEYLCVKRIIPEKKSTDSTEAVIPRVNLSLQDDLDQ